MVIGGKKIKRNQSYKELNHYYYQVVKSMARESLSELKFVKIISHNVSKTSDSIYFDFKMNHHEHLFTLSLRTHQPSVYTDYYFYVYLHHYDSLSELKTAIQGQLIAYYNKKANELGIVKKPKDYTQPAHYQHTNKRRKKRTLQMCQHCFNESFHQLMNEVNEENGLAKQMKVNHCVRGDFKRCQVHRKL